MKIATYIKPKCNNGGINIDTSNLATKQQLKDGVQEAKNYTDNCIKNTTDGFNVIFETVEGVGDTMLTIKNTADGVLQIIEIKGNSIIDESNGEKIKSVGDKIEGENLYKISLLSTNGLSKSNINYKECEVEILLPVQLERVDDIYDRLIFNTEGVWVVEKNVNAVIENGIIVNKQVESNIISLPDLELSPLYSFKGDTTIDFLTEVNGSIKVNVSKVLTGIINDHTNQINDNANQINGFNVELDKLSSQLEHKVSNFQGSENAGKILVVDKNGYLTSIPSEYITETELATKGYLTEHQDISHLALKTELHNHSNKSVLDGITSTKVTEWNNKSTFSGSYNDLTNKPIIPTKVSELTNDSKFITSIPSEYVTETELNAKGYLTEHQDISGKADKTELNSLSLGVHTDGMIYLFKNGKPVGNGITQGTQSGDVVGYVDSENNIVLSGKLADGTYKLKYEMEDGSKIDVGQIELSDKPAYTNQIPLSIASDGTPFNGGQGWKTGYRISKSSGGETAATDYECTGFISVTKNSKIRIKGIEIDADDGNSVVSGYDKSFTKLNTGNGVTLGAMIESTDDDEVSTFKGFGAFTHFATTELAYIRLSSTRIDENSILTVDEPIV